MYKNFFRKKKIKLKIIKIYPEIKMMMISNNFFNNSVYINIIIN